ncbi:MAG: PEP-CTERM sorting domain-containing protein [Rhizobacter sp.]
MKRSAITAAAICCGLLATSVPATAVSLVISSGPLVKTELFRSDGASASNWEELVFNFALPATASADGLFRMFAGGDLNNIGVDWIDVTAGPFGNRTLLGTFAFPIGDVHFTACENPPHTNPAGCPLPETVPGGMFFDPTRGPPVGDIEGRRGTTMFDAGIPGLIVPQSLLVGGTNLQISLFVRSAVFDLYIDRLELSYATPVPEPATAMLVALGLGVVGAYRSRR